MAGGGGSRLEANDLGLLLVSPGFVQRSPKPARLCVINIEESHPAGSVALWNLGFRPFFLGAGLWAVIAMGVWTAIYAFGVVFTPAGMPALLWHGHEMVFGYALAVVAGFLLTAVKNWTGVQTVHGPALAGLFSVWVAARIIPLVPDLPLLVAAVLDCLFAVLLLVALGRPLVRVKQWKQLGILLIIGLLASCDVVFFLGVGGVLPGVELSALLAAVYLVVLLIAVMAARVVPIFIRNGVGRGAKVVSYPWVERLAFPALLVFLLGQLLAEGAAWLPWAATIAAILHGVRLFGWSVRGMWGHPLAWVLAVAYAWLVVSLLLYALGGLVAGAGTIALHALVYGCLGSMTVGMMSRVTIGHTGRMVNSSHAGLAPIYVVLQLGALVRVFFPLVDAVHYSTWILSSQALWIVAFALFVWRFGALLVAPRVDGRYG